MKLRNKIVKTYLNRAEQKFNLGDIQLARDKFNSSSSNKIKLPIKAVRNITSDKGIKLRYYSNNSSKNKLPVIVYFHGGGFVLGSVDSHDSVCRYLAKFTKCVVLSVEYSLAPEAKYPTPVNEGLEVLQWLHKNTELNDVDTSNIYVAGDSAGGNIALEIGAKIGTSTTLKGIVLIYPTLDPSLSTESMEEYATGHFLTKKMLAEFWDLYLGVNNDYVPLTAKDLKVLPPIMLISAEKDVLKDEGLELVRKLRSLKRDVEYECYDDMLHGFMQFPKIVSRKIEAFERVSLFVNRNSR